jgi:hypothetical protein
MFSAVTGSNPHPKRNQKTTWNEFLDRHWELIVAADFFIVEVWTVKDWNDSSSYFLLICLLGE